MRQRLLVGSPQAMASEPSLDPPEPITPHRGWRKGMVYDSTLQSRHEKNMRMLFSNLEKHLEDSLKEREDQPLTER